MSFAFDPGKETFSHLIHRADAKIKSTLFLSHPNPIPPTWDDDNDANLKSTRPLCMKKPRGPKITNKIGKIRTGLFLLLLGAVGGAGDASLSGGWGARSVGRGGGRVIVLLPGA